MPIYNTKCKDCQKQENRKLTFDQYDQVKAEQLKLNCSCGGEIQLIFDPAGVDFVLKDGEAGGWVSKAAKENSYRVNRRHLIEQRQRDHVRPKELVPNFQGQIAPSWREARDSAYQAKYDGVKSELGAKAAAEAAVKSAKTYDNFVKRGVVP